MSSPAAPTTPSSENPLSENAEDPFPRTQPLSAWFAIPDSPPRKGYRSDNFPNATKLEVRKLCGKGCLLCKSTPAHVCRVIRKDDRQAIMWNMRELLEFSPDSKLNASPLCPKCHVQMEVPGDPMLTFLPKDIQYFIDFERQDYEHQKRAAVTSNTIPQRKAPTAEMYRVHQGGLIGGRYKPVYLYDWIISSRSPNKPPFDLAAWISTPKEWHGSPLAALRRGFQALSGLRIGYLGEERRPQLEELRNLYAFNDGYLNEIVQKAKATTDTAHNHERPAEDDEHLSDKRSRSSPTVHEQGNLGGQDSSSYKECSGNVDWAMGPDSTTEHAVDRYSSLFT